LGWTNAARADEQTDAIALVTGVRSAAVAVSYGGDASPIYAAFDAVGIARSVLGDYWTSASEADRSAVIEALLEGIADVLADRLMGTSDRDFTVLGVRVLTNGDILVRTHFIRPARSATAVDWRVRHCGGSLCIGDVIVDGGSVTIQIRDEVAVELAGNGGSIPQLIADLEDGRL
jgi:ABC-type transporter MlaC component